MVLGQNCTSSEIHSLAKRHFGAIKQHANVQKQSRLQKGGGSGSSRRIQMGLNEIPRTEEDDGRALWVEVRIPDERDVSWVSRKD